MRSSLRKIENLVVGDDGNIALVLLLRNYENGKQVYSIRIRIQKKELAQNQEVIQISLGTNDYEKAKQEAYLQYSEIKQRKKTYYKHKKCSSITDIRFFYWRLPIYGLKGAK